jgi:hypothetical protein
MASEKTWVRSLQRSLGTALAAANKRGWRVQVDAGTKLTYAYEILRYHKEGPDRMHGAKYETDLLIYDTRENGDWIPRVVLECKKGGVTTHDALTYSARAETHKRVHPYVRYGVLVGAFDTAVPGRLIRHGAYFDFMMAWEAAWPTDVEWRGLINVIRKEIAASRALQSLLMESRLRGRSRFCLVHRPLRLARAAKS